jgi:hypothetical protein
MTLKATSRAQGSTSTYPGAAASLSEDRTRPRVNEYACGKWPPSRNLGRNLFPSAEVFSDLPSVERQRPPRLSKFTRAGCNGIAGLSPGCVAPRGVIRRSWWNRAGPSRVNVCLRGSHGRAQATHDPRKSHCYRAGTILGLVAQMSIYNSGFGEGLQITSDRERSVRGASA